MQGRYALQVTTKSDPANGNWVYVGNVANPGLSEGLFNPITKQHEWNGTSTAASRSVSVVYDVGPDKHDYLVRSVEAGDRLTFQVFDITSRDSDLSKIALVSEIAVRRPLRNRMRRSIHRRAQTSRGRKVSRAARAQGLVVPEVGAVLHQRQRAWIPLHAAADLGSQRSGTSEVRRHARGCRDRSWASQGSRISTAHHPIVDEANHRLYAGFRDGSGQLGAWDISDPAKPRLVWSVRHVAARTRSANGLPDRL